MEPPTYCGLNSQTGEDNFCCARSGAVNEISQPEPPIFTKPNGRSWPCEDHTEMCQKWVKDHPGSCNPGSEHYEFMKYACMESCQICKDHVRYFRFLSYAHQNFPRATCCEQIMHSQYFFLILDRSLLMIYSLGLCEYI